MHVRLSCDVPLGMGLFVVGREVKECQESPPEDSGSVRSTCSHSLPSLSCTVHANTAAEKTTNRLNKAAQE